MNHAFISLCLVAANMEKWAIYAYVGAIIVMCCLMELSLALEDEERSQHVSYHSQNRFCFKVDQCQFVLFLFAM